MPRSRRSRAQWVEIVHAFERSGLSHEAFCGARGLVVGSFQQWLYRLRREGGSAPAQFIDVVAPSDSKHAGACWVERGASTLHFAECPDAGYVAALLRALGDDAA